MEHSIASRYNPSSASNNSPSTTRHIRPKLRKKNVSKSNDNIHQTKIPSSPSSKSNQKNKDKDSHHTTHKKEDDLDQLLNKIRKRMTKNLSISKIPSEEAEPIIPPLNATIKPKSSANTSQSARVKGILKKSQTTVNRTNKQTILNNGNNNLKSSILKASQTTTNGTKNNTPIKKDTIQKEISRRKNTFPSIKRRYKPKTPMKYDVIERPVSIPKHPLNSTLAPDSTIPTSMEMDLKGAQIFAASAIEGYNSTLGSQTHTSIQENHDTEKSEVTSNQNDPNFWNRDVFDHDTDTDMDSSFYEDEDYDDDGSSDNSEIYHDYDDDDERESKPKAFLLLWQALSDWITPQTIQLVQQWQTSNNRNISPETEVQMENQKDWITQVDRSDVGASRCAGLMSMLKMHFPRCLEECSVGLNNAFHTGHKDAQPLTRKEMEYRVSNLCRTFDYSQPMVKFHDTMESKMYWRTLCCILLRISIGGNDSNNIIVPSSAKSIRLTEEEYSYFVQKAMTTLSETF